MILVGILITVLGFILAFLSLAITTSVNGRLGIVLAGIALSIAGILGVLNGAFQKNAVWRK
jgi:hypothetical protein